MTPDPPSHTALVRRARRINRELAELYPDVHTELNFGTPLELLVATILSAQTTDKRVNLVTPVLFARYRTAADYAAADRGEMEKIIQSTGFFRAKTNSLIGLGQALCERFGGEVPASLAELVTLPGVGTQDRERRAGQRVRDPWHHGGHALRPAVPPVRLDPADRPGEDRERGRRAVPAPGVDDAVAPADLARPAGLPRAQASLRGV